MRYFSGFSMNSSRQPVQQIGKDWPWYETVIVAAPPVMMHLGRSAVLAPAANDSPSLVSPPRSPA